MGLPFHLIIEGPTLTDVQAARRSWRLCLLASVMFAAAATFLLYALTYGRYRSAPVVGFVQIADAPAGASVQVDGRTAVRGPASLSVAPGLHTVRIGASGYLSASYPVTVAAGSTAAVAAELWLAQPRMTQLLPPLPGSAVSAASFLQDGRVGLEVALPGDERQLWIVDAAAQQRRVGPALAQGSIAGSPDGRRVAYFVTPTSQGSVSPPTELWLSGVAGQQPAKRYALPPGTGASQLLDVSWAPDGQHLLLASRESAAVGQQRTTVSWLAAGQGEPRDLLSLPSDVVPGSESWSPDGRWLAFLALAGNTPSLCLLGVPAGQFRYLGDLSSGLSHPLPVAPATWAKDSQGLLYSALTAGHADGAGWLFGEGSSNGLYSLVPARPAPRIVTKNDAQSPAWLPDGSIVALARGKADGPLLLRQFGGDGSTSDGPALPIKAGSLYAARWDPAHAQAIIAVRGDSLTTTGSGDQYWLAQFWPEAAA